MAKKTNFVSPIAINNGSEQRVALASLIKKEEEGFQETLAVGVQQIGVDKIAPNPHQPRQKFDHDSLAELAESIKVNGIIQPLIVTGADKPGNFILIAGERRWRAAQEAGLKEVPCVVREATEQQMAELALVENVQRADLNALEEARAYQDLSANFGLTHAQIAERVGKGRATITNTLRLLELPVEIQDAVLNGFPETKARALLSLKDQPDKMVEIFLQAQREDQGRDWIEAKVKAVLAPPVQPEEHVSHPVVVNPTKGVRYSPPVVPEATLTIGTGRRKPGSEVLVPPATDKTEVTGVMVSDQTPETDDQRTVALSVIGNVEWANLPTETLVLVATLLQPGVFGD